MFKKHLECSVAKTVAKVLKTQVVNLPFNSHEWPKQNLSSQYQYNIKKISDEKIKISIRGLIVDSISNSPNHHYENCLPCCKENYQRDLRSEKVKSLNIVFVIINIELFEITTNKTKFGITRLLYISSCHSAENK